jgi:NNP family nitrate/nitrite transporter-like MFS transporter
MTLPQPQTAALPLSPLLFLVVIFYLNFTSRVVLAPLLPVLEIELGLGHGQAGSLFLLMQLGYSLGLLGSGFLAGHLNHRWTILASTTAVGLMLLVTSQSASVAGLRVELILLGMAAGLYLPSGIAMVTGETSQAQWGKALAIHELAPNLGFVTAPLVAEGLLRLVSWRGVLAVLGFLAILAGMLFALFGRGGEGTPHPPQLRTATQLAREASFWVMAVLFALSVGTGLGVYTMTPLFLVSEIGMERGAANAVAGLSRVLGIAAIFFSGVLGDRIGHRRALALFLSTTGVLTLSLGLLRGPIVTPVLVFLQSASVALFFPVAFSLISLIFSPRLRGMAVSMITVTGSLVGAGVIPSALGHWAEAFSFSSGFVLLGVVTLGMLPLLRFGGAPPARPDGSIPPEIRGS